MYMAKNKNKNTTLKGGNRWKYLRRMVGFKTPPLKAPAPVTKKRWGNYFKFNWGRRHSSRPVSRPKSINKSSPKPNSLITETNLKNETQEIVFVPHRSRALTQSRKSMRSMKRSRPVTLRSSAIVHV